MPLKCREISASLTKKGFRLKSDRDHDFFLFYVGEVKQAVYTKLSHGCREIDDSLASKMARQVRLPRKQFVQLVDCSMTGQGYLAELSAQGFRFRPDRA